MADISRADIESGRYDSVIKDFTLANVNNPQAVADAYAQYGITTADIQRISGASADTIGTFFSPAWMSNPTEDNTVKNYMQTSSTSTPDLGASAYSGVTKPTVTTTPTTPTAPYTPTKVTTPYTPTTPTTQYTPTTPYTPYTAKTPTTPYTPATPYLPTTPTTNYTPSTPYIPTTPPVAPVTRPTAASSNVGQDLWSRFSSNDAAGFQSVASGNNLDASSIASAMGVDVDAVNKYMQARGIKLGGGSTVVNPPPVNVGIPTSTTGTGTGTTNTGTGVADGLLQTTSNVAAKNPLSGGRDLDGLSPAQRTAFYAGVTTNPAFDFNAHYDYVKGLQDIQALNVAAVHTGNALDQSPNADQLGLLGFVPDPKNPGRYLSAGNSDLYGNIYDAANDNWSRVMDGYRGGELQTFTDGGTHSDPRLPPPDGSGQTTIQNVSQGNSATPGTPRNITANETVSGQLNALMNEDSEYMRIAKAEAMQQANTRGLLGSSMAAGAARTAAIKAGLPIAQQDASTYAASGLSSQNAGQLLTQTSHQAALDAAQAERNFGYNTALQKMQDQAALERLIQTGVQAQDLQRLQDTGAWDRLMQTGIQQQDLQRIQESGAWDRLLETGNQNIYLNDRNIAADVALADRQAENARLLQAQQDISLWNRQVLSGQQTRDLAILNNAAQLDATKYLNTTMSAEKQASLSADTRNSMVASIQPIFQSAQNLIAQIMTRPDSEMDQESKTNAINSILDTSYSNANAITQVYGYAISWDTP